MDTGENWATKGENIWNKTYNDKPPSSIEYTAHLIYSVNKTYSPEEDRQR